MPNVSLFGVHCGLEESLHHLPFSTGQVRHDDNEKRYRNIMIYFFVPLLKNNALEDIRFQQDGDT